MVDKGKTINIDNNDYCLKKSFSTEQNFSDLENDILNYLTVKQNSSNNKKMHFRKNETDETRHIL